jgi:hypothetical protein
LSFRPGGKVRVTFMGMTKVGTFELDGKEVLITVGNETNVFTLDAQGCVVGGGLLGKYCKGGAADAAKQKSSAPTTAAAAPGQAIANQSSSHEPKLTGRYKAGNAQVSLALDFKDDGRVRVSVAGTQAKKESTEATYKVAGDKVTISIPDGSPPLVLTRKGDVLEGAPQGETVKMKFVKQ